MVLAFGKLTIKAPQWPVESEGKTRAIPRSATVRPAEGVVETGDVTPPAIAAAVRIAVNGDLSGGAVAFAASLDHGATWRALPGGDLAGLPIRGDGTDTFRFRITLSRAPGGASPELRGVILAVQPKPDAWLVVRNDFLRVVADARTGRLFRLTDVARGRELLWPDRPMSLFVIDLKRIGVYLKPWRRYRLSLAYRRTPGADKGSYAQIMKNLPTNGLERMAMLRFTKHDAWDRAETEFTTDGEFVAARSTSTTASAAGRSGSTT